MIIIIYITWRRTYEAYTHTHMTRIREKSQKEEEYRPQYTHT